LPLTVYCKYVTQPFVVLNTQGLSSPLYGWWANRGKTTRAPVVTGCMLMLIGNVIYAYAENANTNDMRMWIVLFARVVMGAGSGLSMLERLTIQLKA
jgi:MFS family permease